MVLRWHCGEAALLSLRGAQYSIPLSLRGAKRRGNPFSFSWRVRDRYVARGNGLPRQCAHWLAMTGRGNVARFFCHCGERRTPFHCHCEEAVGRGDRRECLWRNPVSSWKMLGALWNCGIDSGGFWGIMGADRAQRSLRGAGRIRLRLDWVVLTREPDTVNTVGGKDA